MREIKFRVWDVPMNRMIYLRIEHDSVVFAPDGSFAIKMGCEENFKLMQFTGLFDNRGNEIYEGDIIEVNPEWYRMGLAAGSNGDEEMATSNPRYLVIWHDERASFMNKKVKDIIDELPRHPTYLWLATPEGSGCKVIGNIHQNPELINNKEVNN